jgi:hypothetical protein
MTTKKKIFIVAGNLIEFESYKAKKLVEWTEYGGELEGYFPEYVYVGNAWQLKGLNEVEGYYIGSYKNRIDFDEIEWCIKAIKGRINNVDNLKGVAAAAIANGSNGLSGKSITSIINDAFQPAITVGVGTIMPIGNGGIGIDSTISTTAVSQYSYPGPNLEQRTKALEEAIEWIKKQIDSAAS